MKPDLKQIQVPIESEMAQFELKFRVSMKSKVKLLDHITNYIVKRKGKQMRPMFVFLTAGVCGGINDSTHRGAALIELLHTATLVHDDVVDDANADTALAPASKASDGIVSLMRTSVT